MSFHDYPDRDLLMLALADRIAGEVSDFLRREGRAVLCLPGGTTPGPVFDILSGVDLDWSRVLVLPGDERCVPESDPRSNAGLLRRRLLTGRARAARLLPLWRAGLTPQAAAAEAATALAPHLPLSVLLLGMGEDMHTASLFPGAAGLPEALAADAPAVVALHPEGQPEPRLTLTAPVLRGAIRCHLLITGAAKRAAVEQAQGLPPDLAPVRVVLDNASIHWAE